MKEKKNVSSLSDHKLDKKKGIVATPFNAKLGDKLQLNSWTKERMPEYLWLGLILMHYGRNEGFIRTGKILNEISLCMKSLLSPKLSKILNFSTDDQEIIYKIICTFIDKNVLSPLTILYKYKECPIFNKYFLNPELTVEDRIEILSKAIAIYSPHQAHEATDLRFLALSLLIFSGTLHNTKETAEALYEYPYTNHDDEKMRLYRPIIRSTEGVICTLESGTENNAEFNSNFWKDVGMITKCNPMVIKFEENIDKYKDLTNDLQKVLEYVDCSNKEKSLFEDKFDVMMGSVIYALKIFIEITDKSLGNSILGRHGIRTIVEIYLILKYLIKKEKEQPKIWEEYKLYGISKYKLILLKARETVWDNNSHFIPQIADVLVNEILWEEFIDVDLKYFDKQGIREKSIEVGEKELYDILYDYDSNYSHGLWGAIRESSMLHCDNANHLYHSIPDVFYNQNLPDVKSDAVKIIKKIYTLLDETYTAPKWFIEKYYN